MVPIGEPGKRPRYRSTCPHPPTAAAVRQTSRWFTNRREGARRTQVRKGRCVPGRANRPNRSGERCVPTCLSASHHRDYVPVIGPQLKETCACARLFGWRPSTAHSEQQTQGWDEGLARSSHEGVPRHQVYRTKPAENRRQLTGCPTPTRLMWPRVRKRPRVHELTSEAVPDVGVGDDGVSEVRQVVVNRVGTHRVHKDGKVGVATCTHASTCPRADQVTGPGRRGRCRRSRWGAPGSTGR